MRARSARTISALPGISWLKNLRLLAIGPKARPFFSPSHRGLVGLSLKGRSFSTFVAGCGEEYPIVGPLRRYCHPNREVPLIWTLLNTVCKTRFQSLHLASNTLSIWTRGQSMQRMGIPAPSIQSWSAKTNVMQNCYATMFLLSLIHI